MDSNLFSANAASASRPAGLFAGLTALTPAVGGGVNAMNGDLAALIGAVTRAAGAGPVAIAAAPEEATLIRLRLPDFQFPVLVSSALPAGTVAAVAARAVVAAFDPQPRFDLSDQAVLHFDDAPAPIVDAGATAPAASVKSLFQSGLVGLKLVLQASWARRADDSVACLMGADWS